MPAYHFLGGPADLELWGAEQDEPDYWPTQGWRTATPESQGMDSVLLLDMLEVIWQNDMKIDSDLVVRNG